MISAVKSMMSRLCNHITKLVDVSGVFMALSSNVVNRGSLVLASIMVARKFDMLEFSYFQFFNVTAVALATFGALGLSHATTKFVAEGIEKGTRDRALVVRTATVIGLSLGIVGLFISLFSAKYLLGGDGQYRFQFGVLIGAYLLSAMLDGTLVGLNNFGSILVSNVAGSIVLLLGFLYFLDQGSLVSFLWVLSLSRLVCALLLLLAVSRTLVLDFDVSVPLRSVMLHFKKMLKFALPLLGSGVIFVSVPWFFGRFLAGDEAGLVAFGEFSIGLQLFGLILLLPSMVTRVMAPRIFSEIATARRPADLITGRVQVNILCAIFFALLVCGFAPFILTLYGDVPSSALVDLYFMAGAAVFASGTGVAGTYIMARSGSSVWFFYMSVWGIVAVAVFLTLSAVEVANPSIAYFVAYLVLLVLCLRVLMR